MLTYTVLDYGNTVCPKTWCSQGSTMNYHKIYYCQEGSALYDNHHSTTLLKPGYLYILPQQTPYQVLHTEESFFHVLWFHADTVLPVVNSLYEKEIPQDSLEGALLSALYYSISQQPNLLGTLLPAFLSSLNIPETYTQQHSLAIAGSVAYIHEHLSEPLSNDTLAKLSGYNKRYFIQLFKDQIGLTPRQYIIHTRFNHAKECLALGKSVSECARSIGYENTSAFSRDFKALFSATPSAYIRQIGVP